MKTRLGNIRFISVIIAIICITFAASSIINIYNKNYVNFFTGVGTLVIIMLIPLVTNKLHIRLPEKLWMTLIIFVFTASYLGTMNSFYDRFWWWDIALHGLSGLLIGFLGYLIICLMKERNSKGIKLTPILSALFVLSFSVFLGAVWEIYEFSMDSLLGLSMQNGSLTDTMVDIIADTMGAIVCSLMVYRYEKDSEGIILKGIVEEFCKLNKYK